MTVIKPNSTLGIIGGGQLGRMTALAAAALGLRVYIYSDHEDSPASHVAGKTIVASYTDMQALAQFAESVDVVTFEFENIPYESVKLLEEKVAVRPNWQSLYISQNRQREKEFVNKLGIGTAPFKIVNNVESLKNAVTELGGRCILKTLEMGYDGKGQAKITPDSDLKEIWQEMAVSSAIVEGMVDFEKEISVIIARGIDGKSVCYEPACNIHKNGILDTSTVPAGISTATIAAAQDMAKKIADKLGLIGLLAIEFFVTKSGELLVNEMAPRPHNSGHWTMDACITSQFEQFVRAVCGLPFGSVDTLVKQVVMQNLIGDDVNKWDKFISTPTTKVHLYGKKEVRKGRKMGHLNELKRS